VEVSLSADITDLRANKAVWTNTALESAPVEERNVPAVVAEMSQAMDRAIQKLLAPLNVSSISPLNPSFPK
jgi:hypothetical protein